MAQSGYANGVWAFYFGLSSAALGRKLESHGPKTSEQNNYVGLLLSIQAHMWTRTPPGLDGLVNWADHRRGEMGELIRIITLSKLGFSQMAS
jgi:hypothetical protein